MAKFSIAFWCSVGILLVLAIAAKGEGEKKIEIEEKRGSFGHDFHNGFGGHSHHDFGSQRPGQWQHGSRPGGRPQPPPPGGRPQPPPPTNGCLNNDRERNRKTVVTYYQKVFGQKQFDLVDQYVAEDYIQHSPLAADGREALKAALAGPLGEGPPTTLDIKRTAADGDLVWVHLRSPNEDGTVSAIIDIFRVNCQGMIQEHWDVVQDTNVPSANPHPFF